jgi:hypothetical protein
VPGRSISTSPLGQQTESFETLGNSANATFTPECLTSLLSRRSSHGRPRTIFSLFNGPVNTRLKNPHTGPHNGSGLSIKCLNDSPTDGGGSNIDSEDVFREACHFEL